MRLAALAVLLAACGGAPASPNAPAPPASVTAVPDSLLLFDFSDGEAGWRVVNDGVMGGRSQGFVAVEGGTLRFTGELVTEGGGFTSASAPRAADLSGTDAVELRVRGGGRPFEIDLDDGTRRFGRRVSRRAPFPTTEDWQTVRVPFAALQTSIFGQPVEAAPFDPSALREVGLYILDGRDGPFRLEVDWIRAVAMDR